MSTNLQQSFRQLFNKSILKLQSLSKPKKLIFISGTLLLVTTIGFSVWAITNDSSVPRTPHEKGSDKELDGTPQDKNDQENKPKDTHDNPAPSTSQQQSSPEKKLVLTSQNLNDGRYKFSWKATGLGKPDYYLLYSENNPKPTFETSTGYVPRYENFEKNYIWNYPDGKTYWFRACTRTRGILKCEHYSNVIKVTLPYIAERMIVHGEVNLTADGTRITWDYTGTITDGFNILASQSNPTPNFSDVITHSSGPTRDIQNLLNKPGKYYVRVCKRDMPLDISTDKRCADYSNVVEVMSTP